MKIDTPLVSIVAVCYNHEVYVQETLDSILHQTYKNIQLIIIDDCSHDNSRLKIEEWIAINNVDCKFVRQDVNKGLCANLNEGLLLSKGVYYQSIACDDIMLAHKIERQVAYLQNAPLSLQMVCSNFEIIDAESACISNSYFNQDFEFPGNVFKALLIGDNNYNILIHSPTVLLRKSVFDAVGPYKEELKQEDFYMWLMISANFLIGFINKVLVKYRVLDNSLSKQFKFDGTYYFERLYVSQLFLETDATKNEYILVFQRKQLKKIFREGIQREDIALINKGFGIVEKLLAYDLKLDKSLFNVFLAFPTLFKSWSKAQSFTFDKRKYRSIFTLLKSEFLLRMFKLYYKK